MSIFNFRQKGLVSVVISSYNYQEYIIEALAGLQRQSYSNIELIVVDDCSTDNTESVVKEWIDSNPGCFTNFIYLKLPRNSYSSWALNIGFLVSRGEYITIHDADDICLEGKIERQVKWLKDHPETIAVGTNFLAVAGKKEYLASWLSYDRQEIEKNYKEYNKHCVSFGTLMFRAEMLQDIVGVQKKSDDMNDFKFIKKIIDNNLIVDNLEEHLMLIRLHPGQLSEKYFKNFTQGIPVKEGSFARTKDRVSVVLPVKNSSSTIINVLGSIAAQTYPELELIIVDDISRDNTENLVKEWYSSYQEKYPGGVVKELIFFKLPIEIGYPWVYNIGSYLARGEYIAYQGNNGVISKDKIGKQIEFLENNPSYSVVVTDYKGINVVKKTEYQEKLKAKINTLLDIKKKTKSQNKNENYDKFEDGIKNFNLNTILLKSTVIDQTAGLGESKMGLDGLEFIYILLKRGYNVKILKEPLYFEL